MHWLCGTSGVRVKVIWQFSGLLVISRDKSPSKKMQITLSLYTGVNVFTPKHLWYVVRKAPLKMSTRHYLNASIAFWLDGLYFIRVEFWDVINFLSEHELEIGIRLTTEPWGESGFDVGFFPGKFFVIMKSNRILCPLNSNPWECKLTVFLLWLIGFEYSNCIVGRVTNEPQLDHWSPAAIDEHKRQNGKAEHRE